MEQKITKISYANDVTLSSAQWKGRKSGADRICSQRDQC